eukprot:COSAG01_NODE_5503_length_4218_cov_26.861374_4_plen_51_part_00
MRIAGLKVRGAYHFGRPGSDAAQQVRGLSAQPSVATACGQTQACATDQLE